MTKQQLKEKESNLASFVKLKLQEAMVAKDSLVKEWQTYLDAYNGEFFNDKTKADYKSNSVSNYIFSVIETIRPIMIDNNPKFEVLARIPEAEEKAQVVDFMLQCEFKREGLDEKVAKELTNALVMGSMLFYTPWDKEKKETNVVPISIFNFFPDPLATSVDDMEYGIYADYVNVNVLKKMFPDKAEEIVGSNISYTELVQEKGQSSNIDNQVLVSEMWMHDWTSVDVEEDEKGNKTGKVSPGIRVVICATELGLILHDGPSPYKDGKMPFDMYKCYDVPNQFWGVGEVKRILSPQIQVNELNNAIVDSAKAVANLPWLVDKNSGIPRGKITNRPGLIIRKNPGSEVRRMEAPAMPNYIQALVENFKLDIEEISGVNNSLKGNSEKGVYTAQGILSLQEASQARVRIKVKALEAFLGKIGTKIFNRNKQFLKEDKFVTMFGEDGKQVFYKIDKNVFNYDYDIQIQAGSTTPLSKSAMFDLMIRLAQTPAEDGLPMVDRVAVMKYMPGFDSKSILDRMKQQVEVVKQDQINEQEHVGEHQETKAILEQMSNEMKALNQELAELRSLHEKNQDEARYEEIREKAYNDGYEGALGEAEVGQQVEAENAEVLPPEILDMISELSDEELQQLMEEHPELEDLILAELQNNGTTAPSGIQGGI